MKEIVTEAEMLESVGSSWGEYDLNKTLKKEVC